MAAVGEPNQPAASTSSASAEPTTEQKPVPTIKLQSSDLEVFEVPLDVANVSMTIKTMLENLNLTGGGDEVVPLPKVDSATLKKIIAWATYHKDDKAPSDDDDDDDKEKRTDEISTWDIEFLKVDQAMLFRLILASNYMDMKGLLDVTCKTVAIMIKGKTPEEIRQTFNIKNDLTPEEEDEIRKEYAWTDD